MTRGQRGEIIVDFRRKDVADTVRLPLPPSCPSLTFDFPGLPCVRSSVYSQRRKRTDVMDNRKDLLIPSNYAEYLLLLNLLAFCIFILPTIASERRTHIQAGPGRFFHPLFPFSFVFHSV